MTALSPEQESLSDAELLAAFARSGDEAAFTTIMGRYAALIRATAQRTTGRSAMVEEVAQSVFALLARKAGRMGRTDHLAAWLHRTAVYLSLRHVRADARHRRKLSAFAAAMPESFAESLPSPAWEAALPVLDECIQRLGAAERRILVMRFFEGHTYPVIGAATGKSEAAVKKQTTRALARLRVLMQRRGAVLTAAALTTGLSSLTAPHAAAGVTSLATAALRAAPSLTPGCVLLHSLHVMNTTHAATAAAALILLGSVPLLLQENAIASARRELSSLENRTASAKPTAASPGTSSAATPRAPEPAGASTLESIARDLETLQSVRRDTPLDRLTPEQRAARSRIAALTTPEFDSLLGAVPRLSGGPDRQAKFRAALFNELTVRPADRASRLVLLHHAPEVARAAGSDDLFSLQ